ncbi:MAG: GTPase ObgE [Acidimicrobiaceae bacterium]|nr:GTPase ObgE [Acidimicrobiaceae bacterium]MCY4280506.1 GTPase ObgE [Acidimicrobiaceae bacterium]MCY4293732.1 GTPase ObgE [Acidimicrobiaceae bacterium]
MSGFVDECNLHVTAGDGGAGCVAFRREAHVARGGPSGGDGGAGGDVWLVADRNVSSLLAFRDHPHRRAGNGKHGSGNRRHGARGDDTEVAVPVGTVVLDHDDGSQLTDLSAHGERWLAAAAGVGGRGNARFLSNRVRAPAFAEQGEFGERRWLRLELKLLADVAIVGFPNVGKSTFISRVSAAKPKIADYPFTTLEPNLGVCRLEDSFDDVFEMVLADIPGLIEGAGEGRGLGHRFLRHVERARVLLVLVDLCELAGCSPAEQLSVLLAELGRYRPELLQRPRLVVGSRADTAEEAALPEPSDSSPGVSHLGRMSSVTGEGVAHTLGELRRLVTQARACEPVVEAPMLHRPLPPAQEVAVRRLDGRLWEVRGRAARRAVALSDLTDAGALAYMQDRLRRLGVEKALARAGAVYGDEVRIGDFSFAYLADTEDGDGDDEAGAVDAGSGGPGEANSVPGARHA